jgi:hypothetical protein
MQSKLDAAFTKYHNDIQDMQAKSDDLAQQEQITPQQEQR